MKKESNKIQTGLSKPKSLIDKASKYKISDALKGVSLGKDKNGYFVYTHRARSKSYKTAYSIPVKDIVYIETTG